MRIREARNIGTDRTDPDPDPEHWYIYIILQREKSKEVKSQNSRNIKVFLLFLLDDGLMDPDADPGGPKTYGTHPDPQH
jgi:hypothetical protein